MARAENFPSLGKRLASARNYAYEASMSDYSVDSIIYSERRLRGVEREIEAEGLDADTLVEYVEGKGWRER